MNFEWKLIFQAPSCRVYVNLLEGNNQMVHQTCWEDEYFFFKYDSARFIEFTVKTNSRDIMASLVLTVNSMNLAESYLKKNIHPPNMFDVPSGYLT